MYTLTQTTKITGVPSSTLRYYEEEGLLKNIARDGRNRRIYSEKDIELIDLIKCLRVLGMTISDIKREFGKNSLDTTPDIRVILKEHRQYLVEKRKFINSILRKIDRKLKSDEIICSSEIRNKTIDL